MSQLDDPALDRDALEGLEAYLDSLEGDPKAALEKIADKADPDNVRRRLAILVDSGRIEDAAVEARARQKSEAWIDLAIFSLAATGNDIEAKEYLNWARALPKTTFWQRSAIGYYDGSMRWTLRARVEGQRIVPDNLTSAEQQAVRRTAELVEAACAPALARGRVDAELDVQLLLRLFDASYLLESREKCRDIVRILEKRVPIPLKVAQAVVQGIAEPVENIVDRLWSEHGESFQARFLACIIQARVFNDEANTIEQAYRLSGLASSSNDKEELCQLLYDLTSPDDTVGIARIKKTATALLGEESRFLRLVASDELLRRGDAIAALAIVDGTDLGSNAQAMRIKAFATLKAGKPLEALKLLQELATFAPEPQLFEMISRVARQHDRGNDELEALEHLLVLTPDERNTRQRLSWLYVRRTEYKRAAHHLELLHKQVPDDVEVTVNLAVTYSFDGKHDRALAVLADAAASNRASLPILKARAQILHSLGRSPEAFNMIDAVRSEFWNDPQFLSVYLTVAHAADREASAHDALNQLLALKEKGLVGDDLIREASLDEVREVL